MLPIADRWFEIHKASDDITLLWEPHVVPLMRCNIWHVRGRDRDLMIDTGMGIVSLRTAARHLLDKDVTTAGRHADSEIFLDDVTVSRRHATFTRDGTTFTVSDAGSLNGTYVNRDRIDTVVLKDSDEVQIGKYRLVFFQGHEPAGDRASAPTA